MDTELSYLALETIQNVLSSFLDCELSQDTNVITIKMPEAVVKLSEDDSAVKNFKEGDLFVRNREGNIEIQLWERSWRKVKSPYIYPFSIEQFTFDPRKRVSDSTYASLEILASIFEATNKKEFEKFPRAILHVMDNAKAFILSEEEGNTLGIAILTQHTRAKKKYAGIWYWGIYKSYRRRGLGKLLLRHVLSTLKKETQCYLVHLGVPLWEGLMHELDFTCTLRYGKLENPQNS